MKHTILASASVLALIASTAQAQTAPAPQGVSAAGGEQVSTPSAVTTLEEVVITAQRTEETAQRAPLAIAVIKPEELTRKNVTRAEDLSRLVPALVATASGGPNTSFFVRGVGNTTSNSYSDPAISFNFDGVYIGRPNATQGFFYDLQRIEVLKGPQGTLYGRNATGGAINVLPNRPKIGVTGGEFDVSYGNYDAVQARGAVNLPLGDKAAVRIAGMSNKRDGYLSDGTSDQDEYGVRAQLLADLTPDLTTRLAGDYSHQGGRGTGSFVYGTYAVVSGAYVFTPTPQFGAKVGVHDPRTEAFVQTRFINSAGRTAEATGTLPSQDNSVKGVTSETNWNTAAGTLTVQAAYRQSDIHSLSTTSNFRAYFIDEKAKQSSVEARFGGKLGTIANYLVGGFLFDEDIDNASAINQVTSVPFQTYKTGTESKAVFGRLAVHATDTLTLTAAGRYTDDKKYMNGLSNIYTFNCGNPFAPPQDFCDGRSGAVNAPLMPAVKTAAELVAFYTARGIRVGANGVNPPPVLNTARILNTRIAIDSAANVEKFTYRLAADWEITPSSMVYASYETGFHSGGFNFAVGLETYKPESIRAYTVGSKNRFFDNRLQLNVEGFLWKYKDQQVSQFGTDFNTPTPNTVFYTANIGSSTMKGVDIDLDVLATPTTRLSGNLQYLDTSYDSFIFYTAAAGGVPNYACPYTLTTRYTIDCSGKPSLFSPKWTFNLNAEQTFWLADWKLVAQAGTRWRGDFFAATTFHPWVVSKAAFQSDASLTLAPDTDRWFVSAFINNIENERRITQSNVNATLFTQTAVATAPRTFGVRFGAQF